MRKMPILRKINRLILSIILLISINSLSASSISADKNLVLPNPVEINIIAQCMVNGYFNNNNLFMCVYIKKY